MSNPLPPVVKTIVQFKSSNQQYPTDQDKIESGTFYVKVNPDSLNLALGCINVDQTKSVIDFEDPHAVNYTKSQSLTEDQKSYAQKNIGITGIVNSTNAWSPSFTTDLVDYSAMNIRVNDLSEKVVHVDSAQGLSEAAKKIGRDNIGAGTSNFSGSYTDLTDKPTIPDATDFMKRSNPTGLGYFQMNPDPNPGEYETVGSGVALGTNCTANDASLSGGYKSHARASVAGGGIIWGDHLLSDQEGTTPYLILGTYNDPGEGVDHRIIVGDGKSEDSRSNCLVFDYTKDFWIKGNFYFGGSNKDESTKVINYSAGSGITISSDGEISSQMLWEDF